MAKRGNNNEFLINFSDTNLKSFIKTLNREIKRGTKDLNKSFDGFRKMFKKYEEPFCEIRQNHKGMNVLVKLPDVRKKDIRLNITSRIIELKASSILDNDGKRTLKNYYRVINIPACSMLRKARAEYKNDKLQIKIPYTDLKK
ncbi:MAG: Hsp20/alpha crystallin family protein [Nanoarchaeota archaeon]|nr:Hsp20/alpha crystallin family protein [Nanoarchaeota archaeon]